MADLKVTISKIVSNKSLFKVILRYSVDDKTSLDDIIASISKAFEVDKKKSKLG